MPAGAVKNTAPGAANAAETRLRAEAHQALDAMLDAMLTECNGAAPPTLRLLSRKMCEERPKLTSRCMQEIVEYILKKYTDVRRTPCPG